MADNPQVQMTTSLGPVTIELFENEAPETVRNFLAYVDDGFYNDTIFHRVIDGFMAQGGGMTPEMQEKPTREPIQNEADNGLKNERGTLAMARTSDPHSASSQFFVNLVDNEFLNHRSTQPAEYGYCVFGRVTAGMDVIDAMKDIPTGTRGMHQDVPTTPILINSVQRA